MAPKKKQEKMSLGTFLGDQSLGSWADEMEDAPLPDARSGYNGGERREYSSRSTFGGVNDFNSDRNFGPRDQLPLPSKPPYTAHLGNLSFDVTAGDINDFFAACSVTNVRIVEDKLDRKPKGFGYVEFGSLDGLKKALELNNTQFQGRSVRISVAEPPKEREGQREIGDWTRKGPLPELASNQRRPSDRGFPERGGFRSAEAGSDAGGERRGPPSFDQGDGKVRDFGNWERKGPLSPSAAAAPTGPGRAEDAGPRRNDRSFERRDSPGWGEGRPQTQEGSRPPRRDISERPPPVERAPTAAEMDNQWRTKMQPDAPTPKSPIATPDVSTPSSPIASAPPIPAVRQRLNLQKRTVSEAPTDGQANSAGPDSKASPFGAAKPIDTATREKEIEEKRVAALRAKKEEDDKARDEKRAADKAERAKAEKAAPAASSPQENGTKPAPSAGKEAAGKGENGNAAPSAGKNYEILRRVAEQDSSEVPPEVEAAEGEEPVNGTVGEDSAVKPQEIVQEIGKGDATTTAEGMEEEGWSTVSSQPRRKGRGGARAAIAS